MKVIGYEFTETKEKVLEYLRMDAQMASVLLDSPLIVSDFDVFEKWFKENDEAVKSGLGVDYEEEHLVYTNVVVAIRNQGVEFGKLKDVKERCEVLGRPFVVYLVKVKFGSDEEVTIIKRLRERGE